jgi:hypothetical protein
MARAAEERAAAARLRAEAEEARRRAVKGAVGEWCRVLQPAKMRAGFESSSKPVGLATVGQVRGSTQLPPPITQPPTSEPRASASDARWRARRAVMACHVSRPFRRRGWAGGR